MSSDNKKELTDKCVKECLKHIENVDKGMKYGMPDYFMEEANDIKSGPYYDKDRYDVINRQKVAEFSSIRAFVNREIKLLYEKKLRNGENYCGRQKNKKTKGRTKWSYNGKLIKQYVKDMKYLQIQIDKRNFYKEESRRLKQFYIAHKKDKEIVRVVGLYFIGISIFVCVVLTIKHFVF